jgi:hypothetical protein
MKASYVAVSDGEPGDNEPLRPDADKEDSFTASTTANTNREYRALIKQLFIILSLSVLFTIAALTIIITTSNAKCASPSNAMSTAVPKVFSQPQPSIASLTPLDCGHNPATARARGCHFDVMSMIWIRHECYDAELTEEFVQEKPEGWQWSLHENGTDLISEQDIRKGDIQHGWVQFEYHITHCLYTWKKLNKQVERGGAPIDGYISNHTHTHHCSRMLSLRSIPAERWNTPFVVLYPKCYV